MVDLSGFIQIHLLDENNTSPPPHDNSKEDHNSISLTAKMSSSNIDLADQDRDKRPSTKPLHIRKQSSQISIARTHQLKDKNPYKDHSSPPAAGLLKYPPRTSSFGMPFATNALAASPSQPEDEFIVPQSTVSEWTDEHVSDSARSSPSTVSDIKEMYMNSPNSEIMGNFVPVPESKHCLANSDA